MSQRTAEPEEISTAWKVVFGFFVLSASLLVWVVISTIEAQSFNRVTGKSVTTWDAMWLDLRVQEQVKP